MHQRCPTHTQTLGMCQWLKPPHFAGWIDCGVTVRAFEYGESALCRGFEGVQLLRTGELAVANV